MPRHARTLAESGVYHVIVRGVNRDAIFLEDEDYERFLASLVRARAAAGCVVLAYCLMTNHVHLVLRAAGEPIGAVVRRLGVRYAGWFNRKYGRVGHLFQDRFVSRPVDEEEYLIHLLRYVWNNPVDAGLAATAEEYRWSSRRDLGRGSTIVDERALRDLLPEGALLLLRDEHPPVPADGFAIESAYRERLTDGQVASLLREASGAGSSTEFGVLDQETRRRCIHELRTRSVSYAQISRVTGLSITSVRRAQVAGTASQGG